MRFDLESQTPAPEDISQIEGMLRPREKRLLYYLGDQLYNGLGEIVELGCYVGSSTSCLARGLTNNVSVSDKYKRIHTYDWFHFLDHAPFNASATKQGVMADQQLVNIFINNVRPWASMIELHSGNILEQRWSAKPIEVLFIDAAKSWQLNEYIVREFFPALIPGHSVVVQQDYLYWHNPWIPITMEWLGDYFEIVDCSATTVTFKLIRSLPSTKLKEGILGLPDVAKLALMDRAIARSEGSAKPMLLTAKARLLSELEGWKVANKFIDNLVSEHGGSLYVQKYIQEMREWERAESGDPFPERLLPKQQPALGKVVWENVQDG